ncbi:MULTISPECIES: hypothetical protein [Vibrio]|uniref:Uncharacterized protein n=1 Tax=Vibrio tasmaniensis TaxID=212663 RepID=A0A2N7NNU8_9VIBR|nr:MULTISPECIES: hypothetical protein [Vibrio]EAQ54500.1 hypothetical protein MED222_13985 [Vibrio sp. MED222]PMP18565.1 hypothetical protein BCS92_00310 [Vibrio tasmaniensis]TKG30596.1 hypothetical protein FC057_15820 [Vibrio tasmaniensis]TKG39877.1 hypothetical protein FC063_12290 [Vibrio tasmaniensis]TKG40928.1 hypothetical protein FC060_23290 [Vibrio tasmaniensis]
MQNQNPMYADMLRVFSKAELEGGSLFSKLVVVGKTAGQLKEVKGVVDKSIGLGKALNYAGTHGLSSINSSAGYKIASGAVKSVASSAAMNSDQNWFMKIVSTLKQKLTEFLSSITDFGNDLKQKLFALLPDVVSKTLGEVLQHAGNIKAALESAYKTITKTMHYLKSDGMTMLATNKVGSYVIISIREQIKGAAVSSSIATLQSGGTILVNSLSAGVGAAVTTIANAIVSIFKFFVSLIKKWKMEKEYNEFKKKCTTYLINVQSMSDERLEQFFAEHIRKIPILAAYIVCIPRYGSPYNFLKILDVTPPNAHKRISLSRGIRKIKSKILGTTLDSDKVAHQKNILSSFELLKEESREFIKECPISLESKTPGVLEVLKAARSQMNFLPGSDLDASKVAHALHKSKLSKIHAGKAHHVTARLDLLIRSDRWA